MNILQLKSVVGYVVLSISGNHPHRLLQLCQGKDIIVWGITYKSEIEIEIAVYATDLKRINELVTKLHLRKRIIAQKGFSFYLINLWHKKERILALICSVLVLFYLSHLVWEVKITGVPTYLEHEIEEVLDEMGIGQGSFHVKQSPPVEQIETNLMHAIPELLYISVKKNGTIYTIEAIEKREEKHPLKTAPTNIIAKKSGTIKKMLITEGETVVHIDDFVQKGDLLVSGKLEQLDDTDPSPFDEEEKDNSTYVTSEGKIFANTWYEVDVSSNLSTTFERLSGKSYREYYILAGKVGLPLLFRPDITYDENEVIDERSTISIFRQKTPFEFLKRTLHEKETVKIKQTKEAAKQKGIDHALLDLENKLGKDTEILKYYILHEAVDSGKVKLRLYVSVLENIAQVVPLAIENNS